MVASVVGNNVSQQESEYKPLQVASWGIIFGKPFFYKNAFFYFWDIWERDHGPKHPLIHPRGRVRACRAGSACKALSRCLQGRSECLQGRLKHGSECITTYYKVVKSCRKA